MRQKINSDHCRTPFFLSFFYKVYPKLDWFIVQANIRELKIWVLIQQLLKETLSQLSSGIQGRLPILGDWLIGWRRCRIFVVSVMSHFIIFFERLMIWLMLLAMRECFVVLFLLTFNFAWLFYLRCFPVFFL